MDGYHKGENDNKIRVFSWERPVHRSLITYDRG